MTVADVSSAIHDLSGRWSALDRVMSWAAQDVIVAVVLVFVALWFHGNGLRLGLAAGLGALLAVGLGAVVASLWVEQRPFVAEHFTPLIAHSADASFPSDHLLVLGGVAGGTWAAARRLSLITVALALVVGFARVFVGVHYVLDVVAGFAIGAACGIATWTGLAPLVPWLVRFDVRLRRWRLRPLLWGRQATKPEFLG